VRTCVAMQSQTIFLWWYLCLTSPLSSLVKSCAALRPPIPCSYSPKTNRAYAGLDSEYCCRSLDRLDHHLAQLHHLPHQLRASLQAEPQFDKGWLVRFGTHAFHSIGAVAAWISDPLKLTAMPISENKGATAASFHLCASTSGSGSSHFQLCPSTPLLHFL
jgi:hypothetical protein